MTERRSNLILTGLLGIMIVALVAATIWLGRDEYQQLAREHGETIGDDKPAGEKHEPGRIELPEADRIASGIETAPLLAADADAFAEVHGTVVDVAPLIEARARHATLSAEIRALRATANASKAEAERATALFRDDRNVSERVMEQAIAESRMAHERLAAAEMQLRGQLDALRATWGGTLADMAVNPGSAGFAPLVDGRELLVHVTLPYDVEASAAGRPLTIAPVGSNGRINARLVSTAPATAGGTVGAAYFYRATAAGLRVGTRVTGNLASGQGKSAGVVVPEKAIVWFSGRSWVYVRDAKNREVFERVAASTDRLVPGGWFVAKGLEPGQEVVVTGAQLLLSEELEFQIRNENED